MTAQPRTLGEMVDAGTPICEVFERVMALHLALKAPPLNDLPDRLWQHAIGPWIIVLNGNPEGRAVLPEDNGMDGYVPQFGVGVWWNGWYVGSVTMFEGALVAHPNANEDGLIAALNAAIAEAAR